MLWVKHLLRYLLIPYTDVGWSRTPLHSCKSTNQMFKVKQKQNTSAIGPNVLKIFSFTESCNSCSAFATMPFKSNSLWCANEEHSPTNSRCRHSPRLPGVESTLEHLTRPWSPGSFDGDLGVHCSRVNKLLGDVSCRQCLKIKIVKDISQHFLTLSLASKMSKNIASGIFSFMKPI